MGRNGRLLLVLLGRAERSLQEADGLPVRQGPGFTSSKHCATKLEPRYENLVQNTVLAQA